MDSLNVYFTGQNQVELRREPVREPGAGEVLVRTLYSLISSGTETIVLGRKFEPGTNWESWGKYPFSPGYSVAGEVVALGPEVTGWQVGDRIALRSPHRQYHTVNVGEQPRRDALPIPEGISSEEATWFGIANIVQNGIRHVEVRLGDNVVVIGLGILGQLAVQYARACGAWNVIAIDPSEPRCRIAAKHGATAALAVPVQEAKEKVAEITGGRLADVVMDVTGFAPVLTAALSLVRRLGRLLVLGDTGTPSQQHLSSDFMVKGVSIVAAHDGNPPLSGNDYYWWSHANMTPFFFDLLRRGQMDVADLITHRYPAQEATAAYEMLVRDRSAALGVILDWTEV